MNTFDCQRVSDRCLNRNCDLLQRAERKSQDQDYTLAVSDERAAHSLLDGSFQMEDLCVTILVDL